MTEGALAAHVALKQEIIARLSDLAALAGDVGLRTMQADLVATRLPKLEEERFHLVVLGEFNHGKSTFVNALLGAELLPVGVTPTTAAIHHVVWGEAARARAVLEDGREVAVDPAELAQWVTVDGSHAAGVRFVELAYPAELLRGRVTLIDTPGVNDINEQRAEVTYGYIPRADAVLFLLDAGQILKQSERHFLEQRVLRRSRDRLIFVIGKADLLEPAELAEAVAFARGHLERIVPSPRVFAVSARRALRGEAARSGVPELVAHLGDFLTRERGRLLLDNALADGTRAAAYVRQNLGIKRSTLALGLEELEARVARVREQLDGSRRTLAQNHTRIRAEAEAIKAKARLDVEDFVAEFSAAVRAEIDRSNARDLQRYLHRYLADTFKDWAEKEAERVGALLERLAEEIIQVTNENAAEVVRALAAQLQTADTRVELAVDTFKYDLGVFALGALGTTLFLFVNALAGGILTLAVPILAVVVRGKVAGEIREQAKARAPEVIARAADEIRPKLEQLVDDFAARLSDFVTAAGDALHKGISEVLDAALAERRERGGDLEAQRAEVERELERLRAVELGLDALRGRLPAVPPEPAAG